MLINKEITSVEELAQYIQNLSTTTIPFVSSNSEESKYNGLFGEKLALKYLENKVMGIDRGIYERLATSNPEKPFLSFTEEVKRLIKKLKKQIQYHNKQLKKRTKDSRGYNKALARYRKLNRKLANIRSFHNHQVSKEIVNSDYSIFALEDLNIKGMSKKPIPKIDIEKTLQQKSNIKLGLTQEQLNVIVDRLNQYYDKTKEFITIDNKDIPRDKLKHKDLISIEIDLNKILNSSNVYNNTNQNKVNDVSNVENKNSNKSTKTNTVGDKNFNNNSNTYKIMYEKNKARSKAGLNEAILNQNWGQCESYIRYKSSMFGKLTINVKAAYSSQECSSCGHINEKNRIKTKFCCIECGYENHADSNASIVIAKRVFETLMKMDIKPKEKGSNKNSKTNTQKPKKVKAKTSKNKKEIDKETSISNNV